jgi:hypothetical protein
MTNIFIDIPIIRSRASIPSSEMCLFCITWLLSLTSPSSYVVALKSHFMYSVLDLLCLKPFASKVHLHNSNLWSTSILLLSTKTTSSAKSICRSLFCSLHLSINCLIKKTISIVYLAGIKPNWFLVTLVTSLKRCLMILFHSFIVWIISLILQ